VDKNTGISKLPGLAFATLAVNGSTIAITRGASHYERVDGGLTAEELNLQHGVTPAQARAMLAGVMCGWKTSLANPDLYGDCGELLEEPLTDLDQAFSHA